MDPIKWIYPCGNDIAYCDDGLCERMNQLLEGKYTERKASEIMSEESNKKWTPESIRRQYHRLVTSVTKDKKEPTERRAFNLVNENIDWAKWSWNPVTGCKHGCEYCYARDIANRFYKQKFKPTFHEHRLSYPYKTKIPDELKKSPGRNKVFVCSMADLFGDWVPDEWIQKIFDVCADTPQWTYIFLTKNPKRYLNLTFPKNSWVGASGDTQKRFDDALKVFSKINSNVKFISCEPFLEQIKFKSNAIDWLIIGGQSKSTRQPAFQPPLQWVGELLYYAAINDVKIYLKPNLEIVKTYPK